MVFDAQKNLLEGIPLQQPYHTSPRSTAKPPQLLEHAKPADLNRHLVALAERVIEVGLADGGGCTIAPKTHELAPLIDAFVVGLHPHEMRLRMPPSVHQVEEWINTHWGAFQQPHRYYRHSESDQLDNDLLRYPWVGAWVSGREEFVLDVSVIVCGKAFALALGKQKEQEAIRHLLSKTDIPV